MNTAIEKIREFNRFYTSVLGITNQHFLESPFSFTEARIIYEVHASPGVSAREIMVVLHIDEGYLSRTVNRLVKMGILNRKQSVSDRRIFGLSLTAKGLLALEEINLKSDTQIQELISHLQPEQQGRLEVLLGEVKTLFQSAGSPILPSSASSISFIIASDSKQYKAAADLFREYADTLPFDLSFQNFEDELNNLEQQYGAPSGALILSYLNDEPVGCVAIRSFSKGVSELKRLFVKPKARGLKVGVKLMEIALERAKDLGYHFIRLDSVPGQEKAQGLYKAYGFYEIGAYRANPLPGTVYLEKKLV